MKFVKRYHVVIIDDEYAGLALCLLLSNHRVAFEVHACFIISNARAIGYRITAAKRR